eukprot:gene22117-biopygen1887
MTAADAAKDLKAMVDKNKPAETKSVEQRQKIGVSEGGTADISAIYLPSIEPCTPERAGRLFMFCKKRHVFHIGLTKALRAIVCETFGYT